MAENRAHTSQGFEATVRRGSFWPALRSLRQWRYFEDVTLGFLTVLIFLFNLAMSFLIQGDGIWQTGRAHGYQLHLFLAFAGVHLWMVLPFLASAVLTPGEQAGYYGGLPWWILGALSIVWVAKWARRLPMWRRTIWAYLIAAQLSGFAAVHWSSIGN